MASLPVFPVRRAFVGELQLFAIMATILVVSAGAFWFWNGWAFLINFALCTLILTRHLMGNDPALLERRLQSGPAAERLRTQKLIQSGNGLGSVGLLVVAGLDHRFGWSSVPFVLIIAGHFLMVVCFVAWLAVFDHNSFASSIVEVAKDQRVLDTGPYAVARHPMYSTALLLFIGAPLALGSYWSLAVTLLLALGLVLRLLDEERYLDSNLPNYVEYRQRVRWRLIPGIW